jgi:hypothetical protein
MKKIITFSSVAFAAILFSTAPLPTVASAQAGTQQPSVSPQPLPVAAPAMKQQNTQQNSSTAKPNSTAKSAKANDKKTETAPPVDNKIAVSDPGAPSDKSSSSKAASATTPTDTKKNSKSNTGVSPK